MYTKPHALRKMNIPQNCPVTIPHLDHSIYSGKGKEQWQLDKLIEVVNEDDDGHHHHHIKSLLNTLASSVFSTHTAHLPQNSLINESLPAPTLMTAQDGFFYHNGSAKHAVLVYKILVPTHQAPYSV
jgi:hypothetical protein